MKRILTVQDISCTGKCSVTAALPILSAMGHETVILPTAVLSTHTAFEEYTFCDLTDQMRPIAEVWKKQGITFDAIYTGYLGSAAQVEIVEELIAQFRGENTCVFVDPVLGDFGRLYSGFGDDFPQEMKRLCMGADVITPNLTEAACLLGVPYIGEGYEAGDVKRILSGLAQLGAKKILLTGVSLKENEVGFMGYDAHEDQYFSYFHEKFPQQYHGTGDVFASSCVGGILCGLSFEEATKLAANFTLESIRATAIAPDARWYGVHYESALRYLLQHLSE